MCLEVSAYMIQIGHSASVQGTPTPSATDGSIAAARTRLTSQRIGPHLGAKAAERGVAPAETAANHALEAYGTRGPIAKRRAPTIASAIGSSIPASSVPSPSQGTGTLSRLEGVSKAARNSPSRKFNALSITTPSRGSTRNESPSSVASDAFANVKSITISERPVPFGTNPTSSCNERSMRAAGEVEDADAVESKPPEPTSLSVALSVALSARLSVGTTSTSRPLGSYARTKKSSPRMSPPSARKTPSEKAMSSAPRPNERRYETPIMYGVSQSAMLTVSSVFATKPV
mmetsp:Transcript_51635/g.112379  ORF Transcript_51635/g.112379 Transcript_51635/m.112379 type:complete len:288 (-) Transcript_51635:583-1446(-)